MEFRKAQHLPPLKEFKTTSYNVREGNRPAMVPGIHYIDVNQANSIRMNFGHTYFSMSDKVIQDITFLIQGFQPHQRPWLKGFYNEEGQSYWSFK